MLNIGIGFIFKYCCPWRIASTAYITKSMFRVFFDKNSFATSLKHFIGVYIENRLQSYCLIVYTSRSRIENLTSYTIQQGKVLGKIS